MASIHAVRRTRVCIAPTLRFQAAGFVGQAVLDDARGQHRPVPPFPRPPLKSPCDPPFAIGPLLCSTGPHSKYLLACQRPE